MEKCAPSPPLQTAVKWMLSERSAKTCMFPLFSSLPLSLSHTLSLSLSLALSLSLSFYFCRPGETVWSSSMYTLRLISYIFLYLISKLQLLKFSLSLSLSLSLSPGSISWRSLRVVFD